MPQKGLDVKDRTIATPPPHQPDQAILKSILSEDLDWKPFGISARGAPCRACRSAHRTRTLGSDCQSVEMMPHKHPVDRIYTVISGVFYGPDPEQPPRRMQNSIGNGAVFKILNESHFLPEFGHLAEKLARLHDAWVQQVAVERPTRSIGSRSAGGSVRVLAADYRQCSSHSVVDVWIGDFLRKPRKLTARYGVYSNRFGVDE